jgi:hypothetical protein
VKILSYTPGPWKARNYPKDNGDIWIDCNAFANKGKGRCLGGTLATAHKDGTGKGEVEANAQLIAAAPELLEALKEVFVLLEEHQPVWYLRKHYNLITKVIAKAHERK